MKNIFLLILFSPFVFYSQKMSHISNLQKLFSSDFKSLPEIKVGPDKAERVQGHFWKTNQKLHLVPEKIYDDHFLSASNASVEDTTIIRIIQEDLTTKRIDFYSRELLCSDQYPGTDEFLKAIDSIKHSEKDYIKKQFQKEKWKLISDTNLFQFQYKNLECTIMMETLADVVQYPFYNELAHFNISWPIDHKPSLHYYIHFVIRQKRN